MLGTTFAVVAMRQQFGGRPATEEAGFASTAKIEVRGEYRYITANGIPDHKVGQFPGAGNPNKISEQSYTFRVPVTPSTASGKGRGAMFGVALNGVPFDPATAELFNGDPVYHYEALTGWYGEHGALGADSNYAHVQPTGAYHYHGLPIGLLQKLDYTKHMTLIGWAADGYPIYGPFCYANPNDPKSPLERMKSGYQLKKGERDWGDDAPTGKYDGSFAQDFEWVAGSGDLDLNNGRVGVTPEFPKGTFYYVITDSFPFIPRKFKGTPDPSFRHGPPQRRPG